MMYKSWKTFVILAFTLLCLRTAIMKTTHLINSFFFYSSTLHLPGA